MKPDSQACLSGFCGARYSPPASAPLKSGLKWVMRSCIVCLTFFLCLRPVSAQTDTVPVALQDYASQVRPLLQKYCFNCHGATKPKGGLRLDQVKPETTTLNQLEQWSDIGDRIKVGEMPPRKSPQPSVRELQALITWISGHVRDSTAKLRRPARHHLRRLTREQYNATLQDLLGIPLNYVRNLPAEALSDQGFSNDAELLDVSPLHVECFLKNAEWAIDKALAQGPRPTGGYHFTLKMAPLAEVIENRTLTHFWPIYSDGKVRLGKPPKGTTWPPMAARYLGFPWKPNPKSKKKPDLITFDSGLMVAPRARLHYGSVKSKWGKLSLTGDRGRSSFPTVGWLRVRIRAGSSVPPGAEPPSMQVMLSYDVLHGKTMNDLGTRKITAPKERPETYEFLVRLENLNLPSQNNEKGPPYFEIWNPRWESALDKPGKKMVPDSGPQSVAYVESVEVEWPYVEYWPPKSHSAILFHKDKPQDGEEARQRAKEVLERFMRRAYRRPPTQKQVEHVLILYDRERAKGASFVKAIRTPLTAILCSPNFLYVDQATVQGQKAPALTDIALASRLSYFLWNSMPDEQLLSLAEAGKLHAPAVLGAQAKRMLQDPRSRRFVRQYASEWLDLPGLERVAVNQDVFREFRSGTKNLLKKETIAFFAEILDKDLSVLNFIDSDFLMLNNQLALHYGVPGVYENEFHRVPVVKGRGGALTQGSVLIATGTGEQSHPFRRGAWVLDRMLGTPPPPPPPSVPDLMTAAPDLNRRPLSEQLAIHRKQPSCAACHSKLDPWGIALENYNAISWPHPPA